MAADRLARYRRMRDFAATPEPARGGRAHKRKLSYVIQLHFASRKHYDFRLELGGSLRSWAVPRGPSRDPSQRRLAVEVEDHPIAYGAFEGRIAPGNYGAGVVHIWDRGWWQPLGDVDPAAQLEAGKLDFELHGERLSGAWHLRRTNLAGRQPQWLLIKSRDAAAEAGDEADEVPLRARKRKRAVAKRTPANPAPVQRRAAKRATATRKPAARKNTRTAPARVAAPAKRSRAAKAGVAAVATAIPEVRAHGDAGLPGLPRGFRLTSAERVLIAEPGVTKLALAQFYARIANHVLPELVGRPLSLVRCPEGGDGACFFQKHPTPGMISAIRTFELREKDGERATYFAVEDLEGLLGLVQVNAIEIHPWGARVRDPERPDRIVMDLDPAPDVPFRAVIAGARELRERFTALGLDSFVRTSGGKGLHVVVPLVPSAGWDEVRELTQSIARAMEADSPDLYLSVATKSRRAGRIFIDYLRNARGATSVASYTVRNRPGAPVATPLSWAELGRIRSGHQFTIRNIEQRLARLRVDPWAALAKTRQRLR
jgi:bifunctional non-homologous end joining protein LigD